MRKVTSATIVVGAVFCLVFVHPADALQHQYSSAQSPHTISITVPLQHPLSSAQKAGIGPVSTREPTTTQKVADVTFGILGFACKLAWVAFQGFVQTLAYR